ncbi:hypothetical protein LTR84_009273 [Exophiala bonariae]|uniref:O-methyltransferase C-terminal domain-containing protein n=1 Tax=Exophiala bonariae TaxID=1690606 RepID=A0AAV9MUV8_9EURO|nr:hypothetical protein LTR84_009273 [Exophiala bonariae]
MEAILSQLQDFAGKADEAGRVRLVQSLQGLQIQWESPQDTFLRLYNSQLELAIIYVGAELGLFAELAKENTKPLTVTQLVERSGGSPALLGSRSTIDLYLGYMTNPRPNEYQANKLTHVCAHPVIKPGMVHAFDILGPAIQASPSFLAESKYQDITDGRNTPFQKAFKTDLGAFEYISKQPKMFTCMQQVMTMMQGSEWLVDFKILDDAAAAVGNQLSPQDFERPFFVDVGGGHGHQLVQLRDKHPQLKGRLILEDLAESVKQLPEIEGVKTVVQDFFDKQNIEGAQFYYIRHCLHDWPDADCIKILQNLAASLRDDSHILIDEIVLPDVNAHWHATMRDVTMNLTFGGKERTRSQWESLIEQAGLHLLHFHDYSTTQAESVIVVTLPRKKLDE